MHLAEAHFSGITVPAMKEAGLTAATVAERMGITPQYLGDLLKARRDWSVERAQAFVNALN